MSLKQAGLTRQRGLAIKKLADRIGLLYFGAVDHHRDEHDVIRGLTVSTNHKDKHYAVGSYDGYDIALVDRYDTNKIPGSKPVRHNWCIIQVSLFHKHELSHLFLLPANRSERFLHLFSGSRHLSASHHPSSHEFSSRYTVYSTPQETHEVTDFLEGIAASLAVHFWPHAIEVRDGKLFVYITEHRLTETVLESAIESALWLADALDQRVN